MVIPDVLFHFPFCPLHADGNLVFRGIVPAPEPPLQFLNRGGHDEHQHRFGVIFFDIFRSVGFNVQQNMAHFPLLLHLGPGGAVEIFGVFVVFQKLALFDHVPELFPGHKVVVHPILLAGSGEPGGCGHGEEKILSRSHHFLDHRSLAHTGSAGDHNQFAHTHTLSSSICRGSSLPITRAVMVSGETADKIT